MHTSIYPFWAQALKPKPWGPSPWAQTSGLGAKGLSPDPTPTKPARLKVEV